MTKPKEDPGTGPGALWFLRSLKSDKESSCCPPRPDHTPAPAGLALAFQDGSVHVVHRLSLQTMAVLYSSAPRSLDEPTLKRPRTTGPAIHFKAMQLSWTSLALVGIDNHGKVSAQTRRVEGWLVRGGEGREVWVGRVPSAQPPPSSAWCASLHRWATRWSPSWPCSTYCSCWSTAW